MTGVMTESKLMGIVTEQLGLAKKTDPDYFSGLIAGFYGIETPCHLRNVLCAEGVVAGEELRELFLRLDGKADDESTAAAVVRILFLETSECVPDTVLLIAGWHHDHQGWKRPFVVEDLIPEGE